MTLCSQCLGGELYQTELYVWECPTCGYKYRFDPSIPNDLYVQQLQRPIKIRIDCYLAVLDKFKYKYTNSKSKFYREHKHKFLREGLPHFEVITRTANSILSPSTQLLTRAKEEHWAFKKYKKHLLHELKHRKGVMRKLNKLLALAKRQIVFLVCFEKDPSKCHRSIIKEVLFKLHEKTTAKRSKKRKPKEALL